MNRQSVDKSQKCKALCYPGTRFERECRNPAWLKAEETLVCGLHADVAIRKGYTVRPIAKAKGTRL